MSWYFGIWVCDIYNESSRKMPKEPPLPISVGRATIKLNEHFTDKYSQWLLSKNVTANEIRRICWRIWIDSCSRREASTSIAYIKWRMKSKLFTDVRNHSNNWVQVYLQCCLRSYFELHLTPCSSHYSFWKPFSTRRYQIYRWCTYYKEISPLHLSVQ